MPIYEYQCAKCDHNFEVEQKLKAKPKKRCPGCRKHALERLLSPSMISIRGNINTIGQLAEANTKKLGRYAHDRLNKEKILSGQMEKDKVIKDRKDKFKKLNKLSEVAKTKYMMTGEM